MNRIKIVVASPFKAIQDKLKLSSVAKQVEFVFIDVAGDPPYDGMLKIRRILFFKCTNTCVQL